MPYLNIKYWKFLYINYIRPLILFIISIHLVSILGCNPEGGLPTPDNYEWKVKGSKDQTPSVSPDGKLIAYYHFSNQFPEPVNYPSGLYVIDINGKNQQKIIAGNFYEPDWSPDGKWLVFTDHGSLIVSSVKGDSIRIFQGVNNVTLGKPDWGKNNLILFASAEVVGGGFFEASPDFTYYKMIFDQYKISGFEPTWSPIGDEIVFQKFSKYWAGGEIFIIDTLGNNEIRLTNDNDDDYNPQWSPDSKLIAWNTGNNYLKIMQSNGNNPRILTRGRQPSWCPGSDKIVFCFANHDFSKEVLWIIDTNTQKSDQLTF